MFQRLLASVVVLLAVSSARAGFIETSSERFTYALAAGTGSSDGPYQVFGPTIYGAFNNTSSALAIESASGGDADAFQNSTINSGSYSVSLSSSAVAFADPFESSSASARSSFKMAFSVVDSPVDFSILGSGDSIGSNSILTVRLRRVGGVGTPTQTFASLVATANGHKDMNTSGSLLVGNYELFAETFSDLSYFFEFDPMSGNSHASTNFTFTLTPEPTSLGLLAVGAMLLLRKNRRGAM